MNNNSGPTFLDRFASIQFLPIFGTIISLKTDELTALRYHGAKEPQVCSFTTDIFRLRIACMRQAAIRFGDPFHLLQLFSNIDDATENIQVIRRSHPAIH